MKKWIVLLFICCLANNFSQTSISPQFSELKGMEDQQGNTHLFYRIQTSYENPPVYEWSNHIFHLDLFEGIDTLFISQSGHEDPAYNYNKWVSDVDYWNNNPSEFIYSGGATAGQFFEGNAYITRFDGYTNYFGLYQGFGNYVDISTTNDSLLYAGIYTDGGPGILRSLNGGRSWDSLSIVYQFLSLCPSNNDIYFVENVDRQLIRTTDAGNTFNLVDPEFLVDTRFSYDPDGLHIYRKSVSNLLVSNNLGEQFSWQLKYETQNPFYLSLDESVSGTIYLADQKSIFVSTDYGNSFNLYKSLERKIVGIYKKPNSNKLYAATKYKIYEITPDTVQVIKTLPIPQEVLNYYPLAIGNKWVYDGVTVVQDPYPNYYHSILVKEVFGDTIAPNGKHYFKENDETIWESSILERVDSSEGKVYRYYEDPSLQENEYTAYDLLAEVGDTLLSYRMGYNTVMFTTMYAETTFEKWGLTIPKKVFEEYTLHPPIFSITQDIGLDSIYSYFDFGETFITLKGCIIDGIVYGDTTVVGVEDEQNPNPTSFKLEQNYPNPFNPSTVISYRLPVISNVTLKVYDILGNEIATLVNEEKTAGEYEVEFNSHSVEGRNLPSGVYFYQLFAKGPETSSGQKSIQIKKMILLK
jgi:hypothetical protein